VNWLVYTGIGLRYALKGATMLLVRPRPGAAPLSTADHGESGSEAGPPSPRETGGAAGSAPSAEEASARHES
jgi:hypothetical protein